MAKLISFSLVAIVPPPFKTEYIAGIAENDQGKRLPIRIDREYLDILKIGIIGTLEKKHTDLGEFTYFLPKIEKSSEKKVALITGATRGIGQAIAIEGIIHDVTKRHRLDEKLAEAERKYHLMAENARDLVYAHDTDGKLIYLSPSVRGA